MISKACKIKTFRLRKGSVEQVKRRKEEWRSILKGDPFFLLFRMNI
jgi:hypothetical protein